MLLLPLVATQLKPELAAVDGFDLVLVLLKI
jgi:hypothetical protein